MDEKLVTLCILTYEKAQVLHSLLENEGIDSYIHNVNMLQPSISAGVRVRISEKDLPMALSILEETRFLEEKPISLRYRRGEVQKHPRFLVPTDFSDHSLRAIEYAVNKAALLKAEVKLLHIYYSPVAVAILPVGFDYANDAMNSETLSLLYEKSLGLMEHLVSSLRERMDKGELPQVALSYEIREGIPEDEIITVAKEYQPAQIFMGSHSGGEKHSDLLGSVTEEVIDRSPCPVLAIPFKVKMVHPNAVRKIAFVTRFSSKDLIALDSYLRYNKGVPYEIHFLTLYYEQADQAKVSYAEIQAYFNKHYPDIQAVFKMIDGNVIYKELESYLDAQSIDLLAVTSHKRNLLTRLFYPGFAGKMLFYATTPMLVLK